MALKSTVYKAMLQVADMDRSHYRDHALTLAQHPSETEERLMMRLLAHALQAPDDEHATPLLQARGLSDSDEPDLWQHDRTGVLLHWIEVGLPDDRRLAKACGRSQRVTVYAYASSTPVWWKGMADKVARLSNLAVWQIDATASQALASLCKRSMQLQVTVQDGLLWISDGAHSVEIQPLLLKAATR
ncbi:MAG: YaeQ family protein [Rubrivivax sp.]|nr:YaeQ family protein [Rubrivivax sp.]MBK7262126.1 YaeQ family protein [Rubrivivax sp.]MBK8528339.1 YaeQ family protein [Rubrivivax sp.]